MKDSTASSFFEKSSTDSGPVLAVDVGAAGWPPPTAEGISSFTPSPTSGSDSPSPARVHMISDLADHFVTPPVCVIPRSCSE